jgi:lipid-binding SYLF domain-containing protein
MKKFYSTFVAVSLMGPASLALAEEPTAKSQTADEQSEQAGAMAPGAEKDMPGTAALPKFAKPDTAGQKQAHRAMTEMTKADPGLDRVRSDSAGYAVFATVGKGGLGVGGAHGTGVLFEGGSATGATSLTQLTVGLQAGGQAYSEVVFFENDKSMAAFKRGELVLSAQVSAVAVKSGAAASARYVDGVKVFTLTKGGLMLEASVGGQKLGFRPYKDAVLTGSL